MYVKVLQKLAGLFIHRFPVNQSALSRFTSDKQILCHSQIRTKIDLLIHCTDAPVLCFLRTAVHNCMVAAIDQDLSCLKFLYPRQHLDQGRFSSSVFPHQGMDLAFF